MKTPRSAGSVTRRTFVGQLAAGATTLALASRLRGESAPRKLGVALVGLGNYARGQLGPALKVTENCELRGVVTGSPEKGRQWAAQYGFPEKNIYNYETMARLADNPDIDIVYVVTPNSLHAEEVITAAKAGKHVISEKPFTTNVADAERAIAACKAAKVKLSIGYRLHFEPVTQEFMRLARDPNFGPFTKMNGEFSFVMRSKVWRAEKKWAGGGPVMDLGVYVMQQACMAQGDVAPVAISAHVGPTTKPEIFADVEQTMHWTMEFASGAVCEATASYSQSANRFRAESASGNWIEFKNNAFMYDGVGAETNRGPVRTPKVNQQAKQMDDFVRCIREGRESPVSGEMGLRDMKIIEAIYASAAQGGKKVAVRA
jgi:glucose-fructose oxidoreductase